MLAHLPPSLRAVGRRRLMAQPVLPPSSRCPGPGGPSPSHPTHLPAGLESRLLGPSDQLTKSRRPRAGGVVDAHEAVGLQIRDVERFYAIVTVSLAVASGDDEGTFDNRLEPSALARITISRYGQKMLFPRQHAARSHNLSRYLRPGTRMCSPSSASVAGVDGLDDAPARLQLSRTTTNARFGHL